MEYMYIHAPVPQIQFHTPWTGEIPSPPFIHPGGNTDDIDVHVLYMYCTCSYCYKVEIENVLLLWPFMMEQTSHHHRRPTGTLQQANELHVHVAVIRFTHINM